MLNLHIRLSSLIITRILCSFSLGPHINLWFSSVSIVGMYHSFYLTQKFRHVLCSHHGSVLHQSSALFH